MTDAPMSGASYRLGIFSRALAAAAGGYALMILADAALIFLLPIERRTAFLYSVQAGFLVYTLAIIWEFSTRTATRAWLGLLVVAVPLALVDGFFYLHGAAP
jgi:hypothetical protein